MGVSCLAKGILALKDELASLLETAIGLSVSVGLNIKHGDVTRFKFLC